MRKWHCFHRCKFCFCRNVLSFRCCSLKSPIILEKWNSGSQVKNGWLYCCMPYVGSYFSPYPFFYAPHIKTNIRRRSPMIRPCCIFILSVPRYGWCCFTWMYIFLCLWCFMLKKCHNLSHRTYWRLPSYIFYIGYTLNCL